MTQWPSVLQNVIDLARKYGQGPERLCAIFDLDSTLYDVSPRIAEILKRWALLPAVASRYPVEAQAIAQLKPHTSDWGVRRTLERIGLSAPDEDFKSLIVEYWKQNFFASDFLSLDVPYSGAVEYVQTLYKNNAQILYLTGRDVPRMWTGTVASLKKWGFPLEENHANLILKPNNGISDSDFKKQFFLKAEQKSSEVWFFENEPTNIALVNQFSPHIKIVFVDTVHSGQGPRPAAHINHVSGFEPLKKTCS